MEDARSAGTERWAVSFVNVVDQMAATLSRLGDTVEALQQAAERPIHVTLTPTLHVPYLSARPSSMPSLLITPTA